MFILGHVGLGHAMARRWLKRLPLVPFFVGTLLPDLIDKPLYYGAVALTGRHGAQLGWLSGTRTVGHTLLLTLAVAAIGRWRQAPAILALSLGMATHLALDTVSDLLLLALGLSDPLAIPGYAAVFWPLLGEKFPIAPFANMARHAAGLLNPVTLAGEAIGGILVVRLLVRRGRTLEVRRPADR